MNWISEHVGALHVMELIDELRAQILLEDVKARDRFVELELVFGQHLHPEASDVLINVDTLDK